MNKNPQKTLGKLIGKYCRGSASSEEAAFMDKYYSYFEREAKISDSLSQEERDMLENRILDKIKSKIGNSSVNPGFPFYLRKSFRYAAVVIFTMLCIGTLLILKDKTIEKAGSAGYKELLTQDNITTNIDEKAEPDNLASQVKSVIAHDDSSLSSNGTSIEKENMRVSISTITTSRGGEYKVTLPDGTKVWLNSVSSIKFPTAFPGKERIIEISGEAYLEVSKDAKKPFIIKVNGTTEIKVLGTHLNINAYPEDGVIKTTLLEGSVQVIHPSNDPITLSPGQQSVTDSQGEISVNNVDVYAVIAWQKGILQFNSLGIDEIMRQISRWYNVDVIYQGEKPQGKYSGIVNRSTDLQEVLNMLGIGGIKCRIDGEKLIVL